MVNHQDMKFESMASVLLNCQKVREIELIAELKVLPIYPETITILNGITHQKIRMNTQ